jgi:hypothetical protein
MMKMKWLDALKNRLNLSEPPFFYLTLYSILYFAGCLALLIPLVQNLIIMFGEFLAARPLNRPVWHERFITWGILGMVVYAVFLTVFFSEKGRIKENPKSEIRGAGTSSFRENPIYLFVVLFAALGVFCVMFQANWTFSDDHGFIATTAINKYMSFMIIPSIGRFFPLGLVHYNIPCFFSVLLELIPDCQWKPILRLSRCFS